MVIEWFALAAGAIWWTGTRLERCADSISRRTGLGQAFAGMLLLAAATSLPEVATTATAVALNPTLAVHNLLGGVALQTAILSVADRAKRRRSALTFFSPKFVLLIEGVGLVLLLQVAIAGITARGEPTILGTSRQQIRDDGIVDPNIDLAPLRHDPLGRGVDGAGIANIHGQHEGWLAKRAHFAGGAFEAVRAARNQTYARTLTREGTGNSPPYAARGGDLAA